MDEVNYTQVEDEKDSKIRRLYWDIAFGLQDVDGLKPSKYMVDLSEEHIKKLRKRLLLIIDVIRIIMMMTKKKRQMRFPLLYMRY